MIRLRSSILAACLMASTIALIATTIDPAMAFWPAAVAVAAPLIVLSLTGIPDTAADHLVRLMARVWERVDHARVQAGDRQAPQTGTPEATAFG